MADPQHVAGLEPATCAEPETSARADVELPWVLDELRLDPAWPLVRSAATGRARRVDGGGADATDGARPGLGQIAHELGIDTEGDLERWLRDRGIDAVQAVAILEREAARRRAERALESTLHDDLLEQLLLSPEYPRLRSRALDKRAQLAERGILDAQCPIGIGDQELQTWWAIHRPHVVAELPVRDPALEPFPDATHRRRAMIDEYHYVTRCHPRMLHGSDLGSARLADVDIVGTCEPWTGPGALSVDGILGDPDVFGSVYFDRAPMVRVGAERVDAAALMDLEDLDRLLTSRHTFVRLMDHQGAYVDDGGHQERGLTRPDRRNWVSDPAALLASFRSGHTIVVPGVHELWPPFDVLASQLASTLGADVGATLFVTPAGTRTNWHYDGEHVLAIQLHGEKCWVIDNTPATSLLEVTLCPGDVLYLPPGHLHRVDTVGAVSVHVSFLARTCTWTDLVLAELRSRLATSSDGRPEGSVVRPTLGPESTKRWDGEVEQLLDAIARATGSVDAASLVARRSATIPRAVTQDRAFLRTVDALAVTLDTRVGMRPDLRAVLDTGSDTVTVRFRDRRLRFPAWLAPTLEVLLQPEPRSVREIPLEPADAMVLVRRLVAEGVLSLHQPVHGDR